MSGHAIPSDLPRLSPRALDSHKGTFGRALIVGGSRGMAGAPALAGMAALRSGAGLVNVAVAGSCQPIVAGFEPSYMVAALPEDEAGKIAAGARETLEPLLESATALAIGPGLGQSDALAELAVDLFQHFPRSAVFDADALNLLSKYRQQLTAPAGPRILTPHPGEFRRLTGNNEPQLREAMEAEAVKLAAAMRCVVILKGHRSLITDGSRSAHNTSGNPGMATGGTGDVLTGILAALLAQGLEAWDAARLGAYVHGLAGDLAAEELGKTSLIASDVVRYLPQAYRRVS